MSQEINYEAEVKKVYPKAYGQFMGRIFLIVSGVGKNSPLGKLSNSQAESWKSAYDTLKAKRRIQ